MAENKKPAIRFKGFTDAWEQRELGKVITIRNEKNGDRYSREDVLAVSDAYGCVNQIKFHGRSFAGEDISNYKVVRTGDIVYTKSPLQAKPYGIIKIVGEETGIVSPLYVVNETVEGIDSLFMYYLFDTPERTNNYLSPLVRKGAKNTMNISNDEWLSGIVTISSNEQEQQQIGTFFRNLDNLITLHQRKYDKLVKVKKSMLEKMFPKNGSLYPEIRFAGFTDAWEQRKLGDHSEIVAGGTPNTGHPEYWNPKEIPWMSSGEINNKVIYSTDNMISKIGFSNSSAKWVKEKSVLIALAGQGKTRGTVAISEIPLTTNQSIAAIQPDSFLYYKFLFQNLEGRYNELREVSSGDGTRGGLNKQIISDLEVLAPEIQEQIKIGDFLCGIDNIITLHQRKLEKLKNIKKSCLEKMFL